MFKRSLFIFVTVLLIANVQWAGAAEDYNYITADALQNRLSETSPMIIIDICTAEQFAKGHIKGAIETNAYPVKTKAQRARLAEHLPKIRASEENVIIVCPRGGGGAKRTYDFYKDSGIAEKRLLILEKGQNGWPYETEKGSE